MASAAEGDRSAAESAERLRRILGYLNLSTGKPDAAFESNLNALFAELGEQASAEAVRSILVQGIEQLPRNSSAFADTQQAAAVLRLTFDELLPAYRRHHADLLFHLPPEEFEQPFLLAKMMEAVLAEGPPWEQTERIVGGALERLNDFLGYRPLPVLENGRQTQPYAHERFRPIPLYLRGAGVAVGRYHDLIEHTLALLETIPADELAESHFDLERLDELALDVRAYDHLHPMNKRTNYVFGEWDPHQIDSQGYYRRFVLRQIILDALLKWMDEQRETLPAEEALFDASAVLCGTILMASAISGSGPQTHPSTTTLSSLLPKVARQRDEFYSNLLDRAHGERAVRLAEVADQVRQPFGHVRQYVNMFLAGYGARQVQRRELSRLYAQMGYSEEARAQAARIPCASARIECEIEWRITAANLALERSDLPQTARWLEEIEDLLQRGIECGAIVDPWNILAYQGQFPLFPSREDSISDHRVELLLSIRGRTFATYARAVSEAAAMGEDDWRERLSDRFAQVADDWDRYATTVVADLLRIAGRETWQSAEAVASALTEWRSCGESSGDITFWREHVEDFTGGEAYALAVEALLRKGDLVAAMGLLIHWLSQADRVGLYAGSQSIHNLLRRWIAQATEPSETESAEARWSCIRRLFDYAEANAGEYWNAPTLDDARTGERAENDESDWDELTAETDEPENAEEDIGSLFAAAYEGVVFRDSAWDGIDGEIADGDLRRPDTPFELIGRRLEPRLEFLRTLAELWQTVATALLQDQKLLALARDSHEVVLEWLRHTRRLQRDLQNLLVAIWERQIEQPHGDHDANVEYDVQLQTKFYLLSQVVNTHVSCRTAQRMLSCLLPAALCRQELPREERAVAAVYRAILRGDVAGVRRLLPGLLKRLAGRPLLYVSFENGGHPRRVLTVQLLQATMRFVLSELPRLGLLRETWQVLKAAYEMERTSRPGGLAVSEFDRLFRTALDRSLECVVQSAASWRSGHFSDDDLVEMIGEVVEPYLRLWLDHNRTMRLSIVEEFDHVDVWADVCEFIQRYGADLFHARMLTLGNVRAILHGGVENFLDFLEESEDELHPIALLEGLRSGAITRQKAVQLMELIYGAVVDKFDEFLEYNTTTTHSDYGEMFYCLLDFLRLQAAYDRHAWSLVPATIAHEVLVRHGRNKAARIWAGLVESRSRESADYHLESLAEIEQLHGMCVPSIADRLHERFVKPLAVDRMRALIPRAVDDARHNRKPSAAFQSLAAEIEQYLATSSGSGIDVPAWMRTLEHEAAAIKERARSGSLHRPGPLRTIPLREMRRQLRTWEQPLDVRGGRRRSPRRPDQS